MSLLTELKTLLDGSEIRFSTGYFDTSCKNRLKDSDDYIAVIPQETAVIYGDDNPTDEVQNARIVIYTQGSWTELQSALFNELIAGGFYVTSMEYGGYDETDHRHAYNIDVAKIYKTIVDEESEE